jgi:hypothetical protein
MSTTMDTARTSSIQLSTSMSTRLQDSPEPFHQTVVFGGLGLLVAIIGIAVAALQLRHMQRRRNVLDPEFRYGIKHVDLTSAKGIGPSSTWITWPGRGMLSIPSVVTEEAAAPRYSVASLGANEV